MSATALPLPPLELRELIGPTDPALFDNPTGAPIWPGLPAEAWRHYLDFGCGCGRQARRLMQQHPRPERYTGVDLHRGMVQWCREHLAPHAPSFEFLHHDIYNPGLNPDPLLPWTAPIPVEDRSCSLIEATSVFTHMIEGQAEHYLDEVARVLTDDGLLLATWFLFEKEGFPFMQDNQNALYINDRDPTNAVIFDRHWLQSGLADRDLIVDRADPPALRGFHWQLWIGRARAGAEAVTIPVDAAPLGRQPPPLRRPGADRFGLTGEEFSAAIPVSARSEPPPPNQYAVELAGSKAYIASLEAHVASLEARLSAP